VIATANMKGRRPFTDAETARLRAEGFPSSKSPWARRDLALFILQDWSGYRISELLSLTVGDVLAAGLPKGRPDLPVTPDQIVERLAIPPRHMKRGEPRSPIKLHREAKEYLAAWLESMRQAGVLAPATPVFYSRKHRRTRADPRLPLAGLPEAPADASSKSDLRPITADQALRIYKAACRRCGVYGQTGTHSLRKRFGLRALRNSGNNLRVAQRALGHRNVASTEAYLPVEQDELDRAVVGED